MTEEVLKAPLDAANNRIISIGTPLVLGDATYVDLAFTPLSAGVANPGTSLLAAPADHVHPESGTVNYDAILFADPASGTISYTPTYSSGRLIGETWTNLSLQNVKTVDYTYSSGLLSTEVRKAYNTSGVVAAQVSFTYIYSSGILQSYTMTRDVGGTTSQSIDTLLESDPVGAGMSYSATYSSGIISFEAWLYTSSSLTLKTISYTYSSGLLSTEVRKIYASNGSTLIGQITINYSYASGILQSQTQTRDL
jgi:hypothetical protein